MSRFSLMLVFALLESTVYPQEPRFEVSSIHPMPPPNPGTRINGSQIGGPGTKTPERFMCFNCSLGTIVEKAFHLRSDQFHPPDWLWTQQFDLRANVPPGATKEEFLIMLQVLLKERFQLAYHFDERQAAGYELVVSKDGPKLKEAADPPRTFTWSIEKDGFTDRPGISMANGKFKLNLPDAPMSSLVSTLTLNLGTLRDLTGLTGKYDFILYWSNPDSDSGPTIFSALQAQLGLKLNAKKIPVDVFIIDHIEKSPTEN